MGRRATGLRIVSGRRARDPYYARFTLHGRRYYLSTRTRDPRVAADRGRALYEQLASGRSVSQATLSVQRDLDEWAARYLEHVEATGSAERFAMQLVHMRAHILPRFASLLQLEDPGAWRDYMTARGQAGVSASTVQKELSTLRGLARWCRDHQLIERLPDIKAPMRHRTHTSSALTPEQVEALLAQLPERIARGPRKGRPIRARYVFAFETGLRPATVSRIRVEDYDPAKKVLQIRDEVDKNRFGRVLPLSTRAWQTLEAVMPESGPIFGSYLPHDLFKRAARAAGLPPYLAARASPYLLRHARLTQLASTSADLRGIGYLAGHRDLRTTSRYVHGDVHAAARVLEAAEAAPCVAPAGHALASATPAVLPASHEALITAAS
jgi:site-specific recombinase XerD